MCGIAGIVNYDGYDLDKIMGVLFHRGPDRQSAYIHENTALMHTRLSILDIQSGHQPMHYKHLTIVFNGEIYNHRELRAEHLGDYHFTTRSDTETLLCLYAKYGADMLDLLDGMFAFAVLDKNGKELFLARDRAGKKPLYIYQAGASIMFASELNAIRAVASPGIDYQSIFQYLRLGFFYRQRTPFMNVTELLPGSCCTINTLSLEVSEPVRWWNIETFYAKPLDIAAEEASRRLDQALTLSVKRRIESSDLEVGSFLSGGIDSGLVTALAARQKAKLQTFTVSFDGAYDEAPLARLVAETFQTDHTEIGISFDHLSQELEQIIANYGEPFSDSSAIPSYYVAKEAKKNLTVILNGDGADELFGGYRRYVPFSKFNLFRIPPFLSHMAVGARRIAPVPHEKKSIYNYLYRLVDFCSRSGAGIYLGATVDLFEGYEGNIMAPPGYMDDLEASCARIAAMPVSSLAKIMNLDFNTILGGDLLVKMDIATMSHSLECRSPFLSKEILEFAPRLPDNLKIKAGTTKWLLRKLAVAYLPADIINQPKRGFEVPLKTWIEHDLRDVIHDFLGGSCFCQYFVKKSFIDGLLEKRVKISDEKRAKILWMLLCLEIWKKSDSAK